MKELFKLFIVFLRIGGFTFGGGYAMLPIIQKEIVDKYNWATNEEVMDYYAIGQCTPGIIAVNTATFIGFKRKGILGAIVATAGMVIPSLIVITSIASRFIKFNDNEIIGHAFGGIRVAVTALILNTVFKIWNTSVKDFYGVFLFCLAFFAVSILKISPVIVVVFSGLSGFFIKCVRTEKE